MAVKFTYYGGMTVLIERSDGFRLLLDPYISKGENHQVTPADFYDVDAMMITHAAADHYGDAAEIAAHSSCMVYGGFEVGKMLKKDCGLPDERWKGTGYGARMVIDGPTYSRSVFCQHNSTTDVEGVWTNWLPFGYMITVEPGVVYYHMGDTYIYSDFRMLRELYHPNVMCIPISELEARFNCMMTPREAAQACSWLGAQVVIPTHYPLGTPKLEEFKTHMQSFAPDAVIMEDWNRSFSFEPARVRWCDEN